MDPLMISRAQNCSYSYKYIEVLGEAINIKLIWPKYLSIYGIPSQGYTQNSTLTTSFLSAQTLPLGYPV